MYSFPNLEPVCCSMSSSGPWTLPKMCVQLFSKMDPTTEAYEYMSTLIMGWGQRPFQSPRSFPAHVKTGKSFWPLKWTPYLFFQQSSAFATSLVLGVSEWAQGRLSFTPLDKHQVSSPEAHRLLPELHSFYWVSVLGGPTEVESPW